MKDTPNKKSLDGSSKINELAKQLTGVLSETFFGDNQRRYNMMKISSHGLVSTKVAPDGSIQKDVVFVPNNKPTVDIEDIRGNTVSIHLVGRLEYRCNPSGDNYIYAYYVSKHSDEEIIMNPKLVFSNIDINELDDNPEYSDLVANMLLSKNNIELSQVGGYIGEIRQQSSLPVGEQRVSPGFYTFQMSENYLLEYDGEVIEAVTAYQAQQQKKQQKAKENNNEER